MSRLKSSTRLLIKAAKRNRAFVPKRLKKQRKARAGFIKRNKKKAGASLQKRMSLIEPQ